MNYSISSTNTTHQNVDNGQVQPLYQKVEEHIKNQINSGKMTPGDLILSEPRLSKLLDVSIGTVKKALDNLVWQGLLYRHQGKGTFVSRIDFNNSLFRFFSYADEKGQEVRIRKFTTERWKGRGPKYICELLGVKEGTDLIFLERIGHINQQAAFYENSWWVASMVPDLEKEEIHIPDLFYALIVDHYQIPIIRAEETLTAEACDVETAEKLNVKIDSPIVVLNRSTYTVGDKIVEVRTTKGRADQFSYKREIR